MRISLVRSFVIFISFLLQQYETVNSEGANSAEVVNGSQVKNLNGTGTRGQEYDCRRTSMTVCQLID